LRAFNLRFKAKKRWCVVRMCALVLCAEPDPIKPSAVIENFSSSNELLNKLTVLPEAVEENIFALCLHARAPPETKNV
jgi:hypothetical protein